jgi:hypothetical protein
MQGKGSTIYVCKDEYVREHSLAIKFSVNFSNVNIDLVPI